MQQPALIGALGGGVAIAVSGDLPADPLGVPRLGGAAQVDVNRPQTVGITAPPAPSFTVQRLGGDRTVAAVGMPGRASMRRATKPRKDGHRRIAVNLPLAEPVEVGLIVIDPFDGLENLQALKRDARCVADA